MRVTVEARRPEWPVELQWEWLVKVDGRTVGWGSRSQCEELAEDLRADPTMAAELYKDEVSS